MATTLASLAAVCSVDKTAWLAAKATYSRTGNIYDRAALSSAEAVLNTDYAAIVGASPASGDTFTLADGSVGIAWTNGQGPIVEIYRSDGRMHGNFAPRLTDWVLTNGVAP